MKDKFLTRFGEVFRFFTTERMLAQIDECYRILEPEMEMHFDRWAAENLYGARKAESAGCSAAAKHAVSVCEKRWQAWKLSWMKAYTCFRFLYPAVFSGLPLEYMCFLMPIFMVRLIRKHARSILPGNVLKPLLI